MPNFNVSLCSRVEKRVPILYMYSVYAYIRTMRRRLRLTDAFSLVLALNTAVLGNVVYPLFSGSNAPRKYTPSTMQRFRHFFNNSARTNLYVHTYTAMHLIIKINCRRRKIFERRQSALNIALIFSRCTFGPYCVRHTIRPGEGGNSLYFFPRFSPSSFPANNGNNNNKKKKVRKTCFTSFGVRRRRHCKCTVITIYI